MAYKSERERVKEAYPYRSWWIKVDAMSEEQIHALFVKFRQKGKI